jgi:hypothetical protein
MKKMMNNNRGFGLMEIMVSAGLVGVGLYVVMSGVDFLSDNKTAVDKNIEMEQMISGIVENVRSNIVMEKVDFAVDPTTKENVFLLNSTPQAVRDSLKLRWTKEGITSAENCQDCPGRIGYVVTPYKSGSLTLRGLYKVTVRMTHDKMFPNEFKQFEFIVKGP